MIYVFDTTCFVNIKSYFPNRFPSFWDNFNNYVNMGKIISVREVYNELDTHIAKSFLEPWIKDNKTIFRIPSNDELTFVKEIFSIRHFQYLIDKKRISLGKPTADPFIIASAKVNNGCVVSEEIYKENAAKIPNICKHFEVDCTNLEGFLEREKWCF